MTETSVIAVWLLGEGRGRGPQSLRPAVPSIIPRAKGRLRAGSGEWLTLCHWGSGKSTSAMRSLLPRAAVVAEGSSVQFLMCYGKPVPEATQLKTRLTGHLLLPFEISEDHHSFKHNSCSDSSCPSPGGSRKVPLAPLKMTFVLLIIFSKVLSLFFC